MHAAILQCETKRRHQSDERLAFAGGHLGKLAGGEEVAGVELHVVRHEAVGAADGFGDQRDGFGGGRVGVGEFEEAGIRDVAQSN